MTASKIEYVLEPVPSTYDGYSVRHVASAKSKTETVEVKLSWEYDKVQIHVRGPDMLSECDLTFDRLNTRPTQVDFVLPSL